MRPLVCVAVVLGGLCGCATTPPEEDPVQQKLAELQSRIARLERIAANQPELSQRVDSSQDSVRELRGRIETLEHRYDTPPRPRGDAPSVGTATPAVSDGAGAGASVAASGAESVPTTTSASSNQSAAAGPVAGVAASDGSGASSVEQSVYSQAFAALKAGSYSIATTGFKDFLANYPRSPLAENSQYWLGETYYVSRDYPAAAAAFQAVLSRWPDSRKAPDAMLKLGYTQLAQKAYAAARATLTQVTRRFPATDAARLAADRLGHIPR